MFVGSIYIFLPNSRYIAFLIQHLIDLDVCYLKLKFKILFCVLW